MSMEQLAALFDQQAQACEALGSPLYASLLPRVGTDLRSGGSSCLVLKDYSDAALSDAVPLRLMAGLHGAALSGLAPNIAAHYPSCGGDGDSDAAWNGIYETIQNGTDALRETLRNPPQTNEVGRSAALLAGLSAVLRVRELPIRVLEIGASSGLNLFADRYQLRGADDVVLGPDSPVVLSPAWTDDPGPLADLALRWPRVVERSGCDLNPLDPTTDEGSLRLQACIWPDQDARLARLRAALEVARAAADDGDPPRVVKQSAELFLAEQSVQDGAWTVLYHSVMMQYLPADVRAEVDAQIERLGSAASADAPFAVVGFEPPTDSGKPGFEIFVRTWIGSDDDGQLELIAYAAPHGLPVSAAQ